MLPERHRPATGAGAGRPDRRETTVDPEPIDPEPAALPLLAAVIVSPAATVADVLDALPPDDVALLDAPTAVALDAAYDLARRSVDPAAVLLLDELRRVGKVGDDHHGRLVANRLSDAVTEYQPAERIWPLAAAVAAQLHRVRGVAAGEAIADGYRTGSEDDAFTTLCREGAVVRRIRDTVIELRAQVVTL